MARKMSRGLVALGSSAIAAVYLAGLVATRGVDTSTTGSAATTAATSPATTSTNGFSVGLPAQMSPVSAASGYADGTYSGTGNSRFGSISVAVTVQGGKIAAVQISDSTTSYPVSRIASLPAKVVAQQSA